MMSGKSTTPKGIVAPPDGGWGWVIVVAGGLGVTFMAGFRRSATLFYHELLMTFGQTDTQTAMVITASGITGTITGIGEGKVPLYIL